MPKKNKRRRTRTSPEKVPVDRKGNVLREDKFAHSYRDGKDTFLASMKLNDFYSHGAAVRLTLVDTFTGQKYPIFLFDFLSLCKKVNMVEGQIVGEWAFCKKSVYYGVYLVHEVDGI